MGGSRPFGRIWLPKFARAWNRRASPARMGGDASTRLHRIRRERLDRPGAPRLAPRPRSARYERCIAKPNGCCRARTRLSRGESRAVGGLGVGAIIPREAASVSFMVLEGDRCETRLWDRGPGEMMERLCRSLRERSRRFPRVVQRRLVWTAAHWASVPDDFMDEGLGLIVRDPAVRRAFYVTRDWSYHER